VAPSELKLNVNAKHLTLSIVNSPLAQLPKAEKKAKARELAAVAYAAHPRRDRLQSVEVVFVVQSKAGVLTLNNGMDAYSFEASNLKTGPQSPPG
jgi:hypothetical protein